MTPVVESDSGRCEIKDHVGRDFGRSKEAEATGILQAWKEEGLKGRGKRRVMEGDRAVTSEIDNTQEIG